MRLKVRIAALYEGKSALAHRFRYMLLCIDVLSVLFLVVSTFFLDQVWVKWVDVAFGIYMALDYLARFWIAGRKTSFVIHPLNITDLVATISFLAPLMGGGFSFLRSLRILRLLRSPRVQAKLGQDFPAFRQHQDIVLSAANLVIFLFVMTELVFVTQVGINPHVNNFLDAMYFTVTTLTTTGFGDITLIGELGRLLSILIMVFGVSLFLRLIQTMFRPSKVRYTCQQCGLFLHEADAVHCKHCGAVLNIPSDGSV
ncbi:two pore domain potassium channel family protein [Rhizobium sp. KVB221]|uniref:Two pore domain potassium channel family protein n=1 Tax=Rhizobium setariae TaxID=2801340 RepID=A0A936YVJ3_9HYPH|nr:potassium channel family protein [Rhizobium setariae]MBL0374521.1 two pore domain potassium channel family protein [Rhizobium setariae]